MVHVSASSSARPDGSPTRPSRTSVSTSAPAICSSSTRAARCRRRCASRARTAKQVQLRPGALRDGEWDALAVGTEPPHRERRAARRRTPARAQRTRTSCARRARRRAAALADDRRTRRCDVDAAQRRRAHPLLVRPRAGRARALPDGVRGTPGSVEIPSAGRHLTWELLGELRDAGVDVTDIVLHCGLSSFQDDDVDLHKPLIEEWFDVRAGDRGSDQPRGPRHRSRDERHPHTRDRRR